MRQSNRQRRGASSHGSVIILRTKRRVTAVDQTQVMDVSIFQEERGVRAVKARSLGILTGQRTMRMTTEWFVEKNVLIAVKLSRI